MSCFRRLVAGVKRPMNHFDMVSHTGTWSPHWSAANMESTVKNTEMSSPVAKEFSRGYNLDLALRSWTYQPIYRRSLTYIRKLLQSHSSSAAAPADSGDF
jgi:hypothetical protein